MSERNSIIGDVRKLLQDFLAPELGEIKVQLRGLADGQKALLEGQRDIETRLLREIKSSEDKLLMRIELTEANLKMEQAILSREEALRTIETLKREKTQ